MSNLPQKFTCHSVYGTKLIGTDTSGWAILRKVNRVTDDKTYAIQIEKTLDNEADSRLLLYLKTVESKSNNFNERIPRVWVEIFRLTEK